MMNEREYIIELKFKLIEFVTKQILVYLSFIDMIIHGYYRFEKRDNI